MKQMRIMLCSFLLCAAAVLVSGCSRIGRAPTPAGADSNAARGDSTGRSVAAAIDTLSYEQRQGRTLYRKYCMVCHGEEGKGDGFNAYNLEPKPRDFTDASLMGRLSDERIIQTISGGGRSVNRSPLMPSWGGRLGPADIRYLLAYVRLLGSARP